MHSVTDRDRQADRRRYDAGSYRVAVRSAKTDIRTSDVNLEFANVQVPNARKLQNEISARRQIFGTPQVNCYTYRTHLVPVY